MTLHSKLSVCALWVGRGILALIILYSFNQALPLGLKAPYYIAYSGKFKVYLFFKFGVALLGLKIHLTWFANTSKTLI